MADDINEFIVGEHTYKFSKMNVMRQIKVLKKLTSVLGVIAVLRDGEMDGGKAIEMFAKSIGGMEDSDFDFIIDECLSICQRKGAKDRGYVHIWSHDAQQPMFQDIGPMALLRIVFEVLKASLGPFLDDAGRELKDAGLA